MRCPICKKDVAPGGEHAPFCSDRCRLIDLGNWAAEKYRVAAEEEDQDDEDRDREA